MREALGSLARIQAEGPECVEEHGFVGSKLALILPLPWLLDRALCLSKPQFLHLYYGDNIQRPDLGQGWADRVEKSILAGLPPPKRLFPHSEPL